MGNASSSLSPPPPLPPIWEQKALISRTGIQLALAWPNVPRKSLLGVNQRNIYHVSSTDETLPCGSMTAVHDGQEEHPISQSEGDTSAGDDKLPENGKSTESYESSANQKSTESDKSTEKDNSMANELSTENNETPTENLSTESDLFYSQFGPLEKDDGFPCDVTHIQDLPTECQLAILGNLGSLSDWCKFRLVCRRFRQLADFSVQSLEVAEGEEVTALQLALGLKSFRNLISLQLFSKSVNDTEDGLLCAIALCCRKLRKLHLGSFWNWSPYIPYDYIAFTLLFHECKFLEQVEIAWEGGDKPFPPSLWKLRYLNRFVASDWLAFNRIPSEIGQLSSLKEIELFGAEIRWVPREFWCLTGLEKLVFESVVKMDGISNRIGALTNLRQLAIESLNKPSKKSQQQLSSSLVQLSNLEALTLVNCLDMPAQHWKPVQKFKNLKELQLGIASSSSVPDIFWLSDWKNTLTSLTIQGGKFKMLPDSIFHLLPKLKKFRVMDCESVHWLSPQISNLKNLTELEIDGGFESLPENLGQSNSLKVLKIGGNNTISELPHTLGNLRSLRKVSLSCPNLRSLPRSFFELTELEDLRLATKALTLLSESLKFLKNLTNLEISSEKMTWLPTAVGSLPKLEKILIDGPNITYLPSSIGNLVDLRVLNLKNCGFSSLPSSLSSLSSLRRFDMECGEIHAISSFLGDLESLTRLIILNGPKIKEIPNEICNFIRLRRLAFVNCITITQLPKSLGLLPNLIRLDILMCTSLLSLPDSICDLKLMYLVLQSLWKLERLPKCLGEMTDLITFHVQDCPMIDKIPASLSRLQGMRDTMAEEGSSSVDSRTVIENRRIE